MCKYCELKNELRGEQFINETLLKMTDGRQVFDVYLYRYDNGNKRAASLILDYSIKDSDKALYSIKDKDIKIKYCPFCGEKLV